MIDYTIRTQDYRPEWSGRYWLHNNGAEWLKWPIMLQRFRVPLWRRILHRMGVR